MHLKILIVDDEEDILDIIEFTLNSFIPDKEIEILKASNANSAINLLTNDLSINYTICDHNMPGGKGSEVLSFILKSNHQTKFLLCSTYTPQDLPNEYPNCFSYIQKPDIALHVEKFVKSMSLPKTERLYCPISINILHLLGNAPAEIYIKLSDQKYLQCLSQDDIFSDNDFEKYKSKNVRYLYLSQTSAHDLIRSTEKSFLIISEKEKLSFDEKVLINHQIISELIKVVGFNTATETIVKKNIAHTLNCIGKNPELNKAWNLIHSMGDYPSKLYMIQSYLCAFVLEKLKWYSDATQFKLTLASFLQDISLNNLNLLKIYHYQEFLEKKDQFSSIDQKNFIDHPIKAKSFLEQFKEIPPDIDRIILDQHEMPDGNGFPRGLKATQISPISAVFILTGMVSKAILEIGSPQGLGFYLERFKTLGYNKGHYKEIFPVINLFSKS